MKKAMFLLIIFLSACAPSASSIATAIAQTQAAFTPTPVPPTNTPILPTSTITPIPPTAESTIVIRLSAGTSGYPMMLEVLKGEYKEVGGVTLTTGSYVPESEDGLTFPAGLAIEIGKGGVTLKGTKYLEGTKLIVDADGTLIVAK